MYHFSWMGTTCRHILASLHFNENLRREKQLSKDGGTYTKIVCPKYKMGEEVVKERAIPQTYGYVDELRDMLLKVHSSQFQPLFEHIRSNQPEPMNRQFQVRKSKSEALQLYAEKKTKQRENVLFPTSLGIEAGNFDKAPEECLKWAFRKHRILEQIIQVNPDVICLEEVDHFSDYFQPIFGSLGFDGFFYPKKDSPCLKCEGNSGPDGVVIFYRRSKFSMVKIENNYLENVEEAESNQPVIVCMLRSKMVEKNVCFAVAHLKAKKGFENLRAAQAKSCLEFVDQLRKKVGGEKSAVIICGDFNGTTSEDCYQIMANHCQHSLVSAYLKAAGDEPSYTTWKIRQDIETKRTIDYIWFSHETLDVVSYLQLPDEQEIPETRFPSYSQASDHIALCCDFVFKD